jgi:hypothetical protein
MAPFPPLFNFFSRALNVLVRTLGGMSIPRWESLPQAIRTIWEEVIRITRNPHHRGAPKAEVQHQTVYNNNNNNNNGTLCRSLFTVTAKTERATTLERSPPYC